MRYHIENLNEITDSREILESRPHKFTIIFIYIIISLLLAALAWSYFSEKEIIVNANGVVRPSQEIINISNKAVGRVESINFKDGDKVTSGQVLYSIEHTDLDLQRSSNEDELKIDTTELNNLKKFKQSILDNTNYFSSSDTDDGYYQKYIKYQQDLTDLENQSNEIQVQIKQVQDNISNLTLLKKSINDNKNYFSDDSSYSNQYADYQINVEEYQNKINQAQKDYNTISTTKEVQQSQIDDAKNALNLSKEEFNRYKNQYIANIRSNIEQNQQKLTELQSNPTINKLSDNQYLSIDKYKSDTLSQIEDNIKSDQEKIDEINHTLDSINNNIGDCVVKAPVDGIINSLVQINKGDLVQGGTEIASILPTQNSQYKVQIYIDNKDIGNIKSGQNINISFLALPYKEYGSLKRKITDISSDSKINDKDGTSYYTATSFIDNTPMYSHKGEKSEIKPGMTCNIEIVTRSEKMLYYLLEQINLKN